MGWDKRQLYETDIRVPIIISGPGISYGETNKVALNIDLAPTIIDLVGGMVPDIMDGQSLKPWLYGNQSVSDEKQQFLIEYYGNAESYEETLCCADIYPCDLDR